MSVSDYLTREEAIDILGIKPATLYAYVSRGLLRRTRDRGARRSMYLKEDIERLRARHTGPTTPAETAAAALRWGEPIVNTSICYIKTDGPYYRNRSARDLAASGASFEAVLHLLLTGIWQPAVLAWPEIETPEDVLQRLSSELKLVQSTDISNVFARVVLSLGMNNRGAKELSATGAEHGRLIVQTLAGCFAALTPSGTFVARRPGESIAEQVLRACGCAVLPTHVAAMNQLLIILAEHELATASFVARVAASTSNDLFNCVAAALCAHAGSSTVAATFAVDEQLYTPMNRHNRANKLKLVQQRGASLFGFNHPLYPDGDPRADYVLELASSVKPADAKVPMLMKVLRQARDENHVLPGIAAALPVFVRAFGLPPGSASALWILSRCAGWIAHAVEQRTLGFMLRPRARYTASMSEMS